MSRIPALLAVLVCAIGAQVACAHTFPSWANDEAPHLAYIGYLAHGELPTIESPALAEPEQYGALAPSMVGRTPAHSTVWTANHAPAFHLLMVPLFKAFEGNLQQVYILFRLANTLGFALWVLLVALIARELLPRRPAVPALAAVVALTPTLTMRSGFLMNDGMAASTALLTVLMTMRMMRDRVTPARIATAAAAGTLAAGTRSTGVMTVAICAVVLLVVLGRRDGWRPALTAAIPVGGVPALATSWFYLRNRSLYGDFTGENTLLDRFDRARPGSLSDWWEIPGVEEAFNTGAILLLAAVVLVPLVAARWWRTGRAVDPGWMMLGIMTALTLGNVVLFMSAGGWYHDRYFMQIMPFPATLLALGLLHVGRPWLTSDPERRDWRVATIWSAVLLVWLGCWIASLEYGWIFRRQDTFAVGLLGQVPLFAIAAFAAVLVVREFSRQGRRDTSPSDSSRSDPSTASV